MNEQETIQETPPRVLSVPQAPVPQTCFGVLNDYGLPSDSFPITDFPPDFSWMSRIPVFLKVIKIDENMQATSPLQIDVIKLPNLPTWNPYSTNFNPWLSFPFGCSRWWNGKLKLHFMAIKPPRVTGKILFQYFPDDSGYSYISNAGENSIGPKQEWDLGLSTEYSIELPGFNPIYARPTWVPIVDSPNTENTSYIVRHYMPYQMFSFGSLRLLMSQKIQPGSIFPSSFRILVFISYPESEHFISCDPRSFQKMSIALPPTNTVT